jgi:hypothetical protein
MYRSMYLSDAQYGAILKIYEISDIGYKKNTLFNLDCTIRKLTVWHFKFTILPLTTYH